MQKSDILESLRRFKKYKGPAYDIVRIGIFGSIARGMANDDSDIGIVKEVQYQSQTPFR